MPIPSALLRYSGASAANRLVNLEMLGALLTTDKLEFIE
jgi:hypothetical protein